MDDLERTNDTSFPTKVKKMCNVKCCGVKQMDRDRNNDWREFIVECSDKDGNEDRNVNEY